MLKTAYQIGVEMAVKEAGMSLEEFEKLAKFLWYRDAAEAFPTFRKLFGMNPEMGHRVMGAGKKVMNKVKPPQPPRVSVSRPAQKGVAKFERGAFKRK